MAQLSFKKDFWPKTFFLAITIILLVLVPAYVFLFWGAYIFANSVHHWTRGSQLWKGVFWVVVLGALFACMFLFGSQLNIDLSEFIDQIKQGYTSFQERISQFEVLSGQELNQVINSGIGQRILNPLGSALQSIGLLLFLLVMAIFMSFELQRLKKVRDGFLQHISSKNKKIKKQLNEVPDLLHDWMLNRLFSMAVVGVLTYIGLFFIDIEYRFWLSLLAALFSFIPNLGPILSFIPAALLGTTSGVYTVLAIAGLYSLIQLLESNIITPMMLKKTMNIPITLTFAFQIFFGSLFGFLGLIFAVPLGIFMMHMMDLSQDT